MSQEKDATPATPWPGSNPNKANQPFVQHVAVVPLVEHRACGTSFPRTEACPKCGRKLLEG